MRRLCLTLFLVVALSGAALSHAQDGPSEGAVTGGIAYTIPDWFKTSFLDFEGDVEEARAEGRHVIAFLHLDECPYCARMLEENFREGAARDFMEARFDVIAINVMGDLPLRWIDGATYSEKELTKHLKAIATPTIVFLNLEGDKVLQLNGYRDPRAYRHALEYVDEKMYREMTFADYVATRVRQAVYELRPHQSFERVTYFKGLEKPLAVFFEDVYCAECGRFHEKTLNHPAVLEALEKYHVVRLDAASDQPLVDPDGRVTTAAQWARDLGVTFRPSVVLFNNGEEMFRADGLLYHHHLAEALDYVSEGYLEYPVLEDFRAAYRERLIESGEGVDFSE